jgi:ABC-type polysaccharide transport system permease subunit
VDKRTLRFAAHANRQQFGTLVFIFNFLSSVALFVVCVPPVQSLLFSCTRSICQSIYIPRFCSYVVAVLVTIVFYKVLPDKMPTFLRGVVPFLLGSGKMAIISLCSTITSAHHQ